MGARASGAAAAWARAYGSTVAGLLLLLLACTGEQREQAAPEPPPSKAAAAGEGGALRPPPRYVGAARCGACHEGEHALWSGSHHDRSMEEAREATVLGDFDHRTYVHADVRSEFVRREGRFWVRTEGPEGALGEYEVAWTFGVEPLQQYLIPLGQGRVQALGVAWDARPARRGGQRWFSLYPDERLRPGDPLHWTGRAQRWNHQCAACHSTNLRKGYDPETGRYDTTWSELDVACEACHGPGSEHVAWAEAKRAGRPRAEGEGPALAAPLRDASGGHWIRAPEQAVARRTLPGEPATEVEVCAPCHSRRTPLTEDWTPGDAFLDGYRPALLREDLYHADGQILDEVYVWGSFIQSRMHAAGVRCSDCHEPHSLRLRASGNALCGRCHRPETFDAVEHHHHDPASEGARCVSCHMPARTYMGVDDRRDHSLRIPRPDLGAASGSPDACSGCHADRSAGWAAEVIASWGGAAASRPHYGPALAAGRAAEPGAREGLVKLGRDRSAPAIARATALALLANWPGPGSLEVIRAAAADPEPLVRLGALEALAPAPPDLVWAAAGHLLRDRVRVVRVEAGRLLAGFDPAWLRPEQRRQRGHALAEYVESQRLASDQPEAQVNLGLIHQAQGDPARAEAAYRRAISLAPTFLPATANLVDLYRAQGKDAEGEALLRDALTRQPDAAPLHHALGLLRVRQGRREEGLSSLGRAAELDPGSPRFARVYAVALDSMGRGGQALDALETARARHPGDREILFTLATFHRDRGSWDAARRVAEDLLARYPEDEAARRLRASLEDLAARNAGPEAVEKGPP